MNLGRLSELMPSRLTVAAVLGCIVFIPLAIWASWSASVANRERQAAQATADAYHLAITAPTTGYIAKLATCKASLSGAEGSLRVQNAAVEKLRQAAAADAARADSLVRAAQLQASAAERRAQSVLQSQPRDGEGRCEAAFRLHQETVE